MILVTEAGYQGTVAFSASSTLPVSASIRRCASAYARRGANTASAAASTMLPSRDLPGNGRRSGTIRFRSLETGLPTTKGGVELGFQACPARSVTAAANLYRPGDPEQRSAR